jgi:hypothetical protein
VRPGNAPPKHVLEGLSHMPGYNQQPPRFIAYWLGYRSKDSNGQLTPPLTAVPAYVDVVVLAFALVRPGNVIDPCFLFNPPNSADVIKAGIKTLQARGQKVLLSVGGYAGNCWANVTDANALAASIMALVDDWGLDGIDIDYEGDNPLNDWMKVSPCPNTPGPISTTTLDNLIMRLRDLLGLKRYLTAVTTSGDDYITDSLGHFNWVSTMDYWAEQTYFQLEQTYVSNHRDTTFVPFVLGVACQEQSVAQVQQLCSTTPLKGTLSMMLWDLSEDNPAFTKEPLWTYANTINQNLPPG